MKSSKFRPSSGRFTNKFWIAVGSVVLLYFLYIIRGLAKDEIVSPELTLLQNRIDKLSISLKQDPSILALEKFGNTIDESERTQRRQMYAIEQLNDAIRSITGENLADRKNHDLVEDTSTIKISNLIGKCFKLDKNYWTYELCVGKSIRQYHVGDSSFSLGNYVQEIEVLPHHALPSNIKFIHEFRNGDDCPTSEKRSADVHFDCGASNTTTSLVSITEPSICHYQLTLAVSSSVCT